MGSNLLFRFRSGTHSLNQESVKHVLWECSEYSSIHKEFIINLNGISANNFYLKSSFNKTKSIFDQSIWECNDHFDY